VQISRIAVAFETGRDGFWLARWLRAREIEAHVIYTSSTAVSLRLAALRGVGVCQFPTFVFQDDMMT
jgi:DNA-binding transcriptional LysR family regulator